MFFYKKEDNLIIFDFILFKIKLNSLKKYSLKECIFKNNKLIINNKNYNTLHKINGLDLQFLGRNAEIILDKNTKFINCKFIIKNDVKICIKKSKYKICNLTITTSDNSNIFIDENFSCNGVYMELHDEAFKKVKIGKDNMFSYGILIRNSDGHAIYDIESKKILNEGGDIIIGDHVWCGCDVKILKRTKIPSNSVIGAGTICNKSFEENNIILAGVPAKIVKRNINWERKTPVYNKEVC